MAAVLYYTLSQPLSAYLQMWHRDLFHLLRGELAAPRFQMAQPAHVEGEGSLVHQSDDEDMILKQHLHMACHWTL